MDTKSVAWVTGLFEGEGCVSLRHRTPNTKGYLVVNVTMTDEDVVRRFADITNAKFYGPYHHRNPKWKPYYRAHIQGNHAVAWLMTMLPQLGERRKAKAIDLLKKWKESWIPQP